jgi:hypothetical protein
MLNSGWFHDKTCPVAAFTSGICNVYTWPRQQLTLFFGNNYSGQYTHTAYCLYVLQIPSKKRKHRLAVSLWCYLHSCMSSGRLMTVRYTFSGCIKWCLDLFVYYGGLQKKYCLQPTEGLEPSTSALRMRCSTR